MLKQEKNITINILKTITQLHCKRRLIIGEKKSNFFNIFSTATYFYSKIFLFYFKKEPQQVHGSGQREQHAGHLVPGQHLPGVGGNRPPRRRDLCPAPFGSERGAKPEVPDAPAQAQADGAVEAHQVQVRCFFFLSTYIFFKHIKYR